VNPHWDWDAEFVANVVTLIALGGSFGYFAHVVYTRNRAGRRDRLVWGLIGVFNAVLVLSAMNLSALIGVLPDEDWIRWPARVIAVVFAVNGAIAAKQAEPLVYLSDLRILNDRILNKRKIIAAQDNEIALLKKQIALLQARVGDPEVHGD
jgi:hypothetical protein